MDYYGGPSYDDLNDLKQEMYSKVESLEFQIKALEDQIKPKQRDNQHFLEEAAEAIDTLYSVAQHFGSDNLEVASNLADKALKKICGKYSWELILEKEKRK